MCGNGQWTESGGNKTYDQTPFPSKQTYKQTGEGT